MNPQLRLVRASRWVDGQLVILRSLANRAVRLPHPEKLRLLSFATIETHNAVSSFMRSYYLSCATCAYLVGGTRIVTGVNLRSPQEALTDAVHREKHWLGHRSGPWTAREEPTWYDANVLIRLLNAIGCSTLPGVAAAFGIGGHALLHLTTARNFFAHRGAETGIKLRNLGISYGLGYPADPVAVVASRAPGRPQSVIEDWIDDLATIFSLLPS